MKTLVIDNYDSFTFNLVEILASVNGERPMVIKNNEYNYDQIALFDIANIVISPGPGNPQNPSDFGVCLDVLRSSPKPILAVCLGHQGMLLASNPKAKIVPAAEPRHGRTSEITHDGKGIFQDLPSPLLVARYHSLIVPENHLPAELAVIARDHAGQIMAMQHRQKPQWGVQFHPESILTPKGRKIIENFKELTLQYYQTSHAKPDLMPNSRLSNKKPAVAVPDQLGKNLSPQPKIKKQLYWLKLPKIILPTCELQQLAPEIFQIWFLQEKSQYEKNLPLKKLSNQTIGNTCWLETHKGAIMARHEYDTATTTDSLLAQWLPDGTITITDDLATEKNPAINHLPTLATNKKSNFFDQLENILTGYEITALELTEQGDLADSLSNPITSNQIPVGLYGFFAYECRQICPDAWQEPIKQPATKLNHTQPLAWWLAPSRILWLDYQMGDLYLLALMTETKTPKANNIFFSQKNWLKQTAQEISLWAKNWQLSLKSNTKSKSNNKLSDLTFQPLIDKTAYIKQIEQAKTWIEQGQVYQICLTNEFLLHRGKTTYQPEPFQVYKILRQQNPAPYSGFIHWQGQAASNGQKMVGALMITSPESFLTLDNNGQVKTKPIKGTIPRDLDDATNDNMLKNQLAQSEKNLAENAMIVDLLRNDLARLCVTNSVKAEELFVIESYKTVHQMVSTIIGQLPAGKSILDLLRVTFPGGSMTGAPKIRAMQLLQTLEQRQRGIYAGVFGFLNYDSSANLNMVIRQIIADQMLNQDWLYHIAVGGGIVAQSSPTEEWQEIIWKARASLMALATAFTAKADKTPITFETLMSLISDKPAVIKKIT